MDTADDQDMPIYEYACEKCDAITEVMQKVGDPAPKRCPRCGGKRLSKVMSRSTFQLKGGGWYSDLYGSSKGAAKSSEAPKAPEKKSSGSK